MRGKGLTRDGNQQPWGGATERITIFKSRAEKNDSKKKKNTLHRPKADQWLRDVATETSSLVSIQ